MHLVSEKKRKSDLLRYRRLFLIKPYSLSFEAFKPVVCVHKKISVEGSFVILYLSLSRKTLEKLENETFSSSCPSGLSCLSSCLLSEYLRKQKARRKWRRSQQKRSQPLLFSHNTRKTQINTHQAVIFKRYTSYHKTQEAALCAQTICKNQMLLSAYLGLESWVLQKRNETKSKFLIIFFKLEFIQVTYNI